MNVYNAGFLTVVATGATITTSATSARVPIPVAADGQIPRFVRIAASQSACVRLGNSTASATAADLQVQPGDAVVLASLGNTHIAAIQVTTAGVVQISPVESI